MHSTWFFYMSTARGPFSDWRMLKLHICYLELWFCGFFYQETAYRSVVCSAVPLTPLTSWHTNRKWMCSLPLRRCDATDQSSLSAWLSFGACTGWWRITSAALTMMLKLAEQPNVNNDFDYIVFGNVSPAWIYSLWHWGGGLISAPTPF